MRPAMAIHASVRSQKSHEDYHKFIALSYTSNNEVTLFREKYKAAGISSKEFIELFLTQNFFDTKSKVERLNKKSEGVFCLELVKNDYSKLTCYTLRLTDKTQTPHEVTNFEHCKFEPISWFGNGIPDVGNCCFITTVLQLTFLNPALANCIKQSALNIPVSACKIIVEKEFISLSSSEAFGVLINNEKAEALTYFCSQISKAPLESLCKNGTGELTYQCNFTELKIQIPKEKFILYRELICSTTVVLNALSSQETFNDNCIPKEFMEDFLKQFKRFSEELQLRSFFNEGYDMWLEMSDPNEFMRVFYPIFGIDHTILPTLTVKNELQFYQRSNPNQVIAVHPFPPEREDFRYFNINQQALSLNACFNDKFLSTENDVTQEQLEGYIEDYEKEFETKILEESTSIALRTHRQLQCKKEPPNHIILTLKLVKPDTMGRPQKLFTMVEIPGRAPKKVDSGSIILQDLVYNDFLTSMTFYSEVGSKTLKATYEIDTVICHVGFSAVTGHYVLLKYHSETEQLIYYDNSKVTLVADKTNGLKQFENQATDFISRMLLCGYMYNAKLIKTEECPSIATPISKPESIPTPMETIVDTTTHSTVSHDSKDQDKELNVNEPSSAESSNDKSDKIALPS